MGILNRPPDPPKPKWLGAGREIIGDPIRGRRAVMVYRVYGTDEVCVEYSDGQPPHHTRMRIHNWNDSVCKLVFEPAEMPINGSVGPTWPEVNHPTAG